MDEHLKSVGFQLRELHIYLKRFIEAQEEETQLVQFRGPQMWTLGYLATHQHERVYQKDIEENLSIRKSTASKLIERLLKQGLIETFTSVEDRRLKEIRLSEKGKAILSIAQKRMEEMEKAITKNLTQDDIDRLLEMIEKMKQGINIEE